MIIDVIPDRGRPFLTPKARAEARSCAERAKARVVVTGGAGFIGSHLVDALIGTASAVLVVDDLSTGKRATSVRPLAAGVELVQLDVRDGPGVLEAFAGFRPDVVFHLAAQMNVRVSMVEAARDADINVIGSINASRRPLPAASPEW